MVDLAKRAKFYGMGGAFCFLLAIEFSMLTQIGLIYVPISISLVFSLLGCLIGIFLLALGAKSKEALHHGTITFVLNIIALIFVLLILYGVQIFI